MTRAVVRYGPDPDQYGELWSPNMATGPVVVLVHGGYWRRRYGLDLMHPLAEDLRARGYPVYNLEYRRLGGPGGGWPGTFEDIAAGLDALPGTGPVAVVGHSAGGHLALWAGAQPLRRRPAFVGSLAGICDLTEAARRHLSDDAVVELLGGTPEQRPDRYRRACPTRLLPLGVPQLVVHGTADAHVPYDLAPAYAAAATAAGDECTLLTLPDVDHFAVIDPDSAAWETVAGYLDRWRAGQTGT